MEKFPKICTHAHTFSDYLFYNHLKEIFKKNLVAFFAHFTKLQMVNAVSALNHRTFTFVFS